MEPGTVIAAALDDALAEADHLELDPASTAIAGAELLASCAGQPADDLPDQVRRWVAGNGHDPHAAEIEQAVHAVQRVRDDSELRESWEEEQGPENSWLPAVDDLLARLQALGHRRAGGAPALVDSRLHRISAGLRGRFRPVRRLGRAAPPPSVALAFSRGQSSREP